MKEKEKFLISPKREELFNSSRLSLVAEGAKLDFLDSDDDSSSENADHNDAASACSSTCSQLTNTTSGDESMVRVSILRKWHNSFKRSLRRRARRAKATVPKALHPVLDIILKNPNELLYSNHSLRISRIFMSLSSVALIAGRNGTAFLLSSTALLVFGFARRISHCIFLDKWLWLSGSTIFVALVSFTTLALSVRTQKKDVSAYLWLTGYLLQKVWGYSLGYYMYRHVESLHFLEIHLCILEGRNLASQSFSSVFSRRSKTRASVIDVYHGGALLARTNDHERKRFCFGVLSTSLEHYKQVECRLIAPNQSSELGVAKVALPEMRNVKMINLFTVLDENGNNRGQLLVEVEIRPQSSS